MTRYARRPEQRSRRRGWLRAGMSTVGATAAQNPVAVGGTTAFLVSFAFVSANALWYQPQIHPSAFVSTRGVATAPVADPAPLPEPAPRSEVSPEAFEPEDVASQAEPESTGSVPAQTGDAKVRAVQAVLEDLGLYRGPVDGVVGPQTNAAVESYRRIVGLDVRGGIDTQLLRQLGLEQTAAAAPSVPKPTPRSSVETAKIETVSAPAGDPAIMRVQAGLKAFGNDGIEVDGVMGEKTRLAIREFQSLFGLQVTGEADAALMAKMQEIGLTN